MGTSIIRIGFWAPFVITKRSPQEYVFLEIIQACILTRVVGSKVAREAATCRCATARGTGIKTLHSATLRLIHHCAFQNLQLTVSSSLFWGEGGEGFRGIPVSGFKLRVCQLLFGLGIIRKSHRAVGKTGDIITEFFHPYITHIL